MSHCDRELLLRLYEDRLQLHEDGDQVLAHLEACEDCQKISDEVWAEIQPPGLADPVAPEATELVASRAVREVRLLSLIRASLNLAFKGAALLFTALSIPFEEATGENEISEFRGRRK